MSAVRLTIVSILILVIVIGFSPFAGEELSQAWKDIRPALLGFMDHVYAAIRNYVAGSGAENSIDDNAPSVDFDIIITMDRGNFLWT
jgi:hypothetical protein